MAAPVHSPQHKRARQGDAILRHTTGLNAVHADFGVGPYALFIHGFTADASYMSKLMAAFEGAGFKCFAFEHDCFRGIDEAARSLQELLDGFDRDPHRQGLISGERMVVVGHSMGGLVARAHVALAGGAKYVRKVITLGTPHEGTLNNATSLRYLLRWGESVSSLNPRAFKRSNRSALQLTLADKATPRLLEQLKAPLPAGAAVEFHSLSGGYAQIEFGRNAFVNFAANQFLQNLLPRPNDGLVAESSSDLSQLPFASCAPGCRHQRSYADWRKTNHTHLVDNQSVHLAAIGLAR